MKGVTKVLVTGVMALLPSVGWATDISCVFAHECLEAEECAETTYELNVVTDVLPDEGKIAIGAATLSDETGERASIIVVEKEYVLIESQTDDARVALAVTPDGTSRYQVLYPAQPLSVVYLGTCDGVF